MRPLLFLLSVFSFLLSAHSGLADTHPGDLAGRLAASSEFAPVIDAFNSGKFESALQQMQAHPQDDGTYYYNLGTVLLKLGKTGQATAYLEKANRMQPHDVAIQQNLLLARNALSQTVGAEKLDPASSWSENLTDRLSLDEIRGAFGLVAFVIALFWIRSYLKTRSLRETLMKPAGWLGIGALAITAALYGIERLSGLNPVAVCLEHTSIRSGPGDSYVELAQMEAGVKLRALGPTSEQVSTQPAASPVPGASPSASPSAGPATADTVQAPPLWRQIRYSSDGIGWVRASSVLLL
jgi:tetratricopeptide (TPR) repeat protein